MSNPHNQTIDLLRDERRGKREAHFANTEGAMP